MDVSDQLPTFTENFGAGSITHAVALICVVLSFPCTAFLYSGFEQLSVQLKYSGVWQHEGEEGIP